jgi:hypothetical protein
MGVRSVVEYGNGPSGFLGVYVRLGSGGESILRVEANTPERREMERSVVEGIRRGMDWDGGLV